MFALSRHEGNRFITNKCNSLMPTDKCIWWLLSTCLVVGQYLEGSTLLQRELCDIQVVHSLQAALCWYNMLNVNPII